MLLIGLHHVVLVLFPIAALFFLRFYRDTREPLFGSFALAFAILEGSAVGVWILEHVDEALPWIYAPRALAFLVIGALLIQLVAGATNLLLAAPVWMQLLHLFLADTLWILLVLLGAAVLAVPAVVPSRR